MSLKALVVDWSGNSVQLSSGAVTRFLSQELKLTDYAAPGTDWEDILANPAPPDVIIHWLAYEHQYYALQRQVLKAWGRAPFQIGLNNEGNHLWARRDDYYFGVCGSSDGCAFNFSCFDPFIATMLSGSLAEAAKFSFWPQEVLRAAFAGRQQLLATPKTRFCNFVCSHKSSYYPYTQERIKLYERLSDYKPVASGGRIRNNTSELRQLEEQDAKCYGILAGLPPDGSLEKFLQLPPTSRTSVSLLGGGGSLEKFLQLPPAKLRFLAQYKFTIAAENQIRPNYITEKVLHPLLAGSVPLYLGCAEVRELINPKAIINCADYPTYAKLIERVRELDNDPELYESMRAEPPFHRASLIHTYSRQQLQQRLEPLRQLLAEHLVRRRELRLSPATRSERRLLWLWQQVLVKLKVRLAFLQALLLRLRLAIRRRELG